MMYGWDYSGAGGWWMLAAIAVFAAAVLAYVWLTIHRPGSDSRSRAEELLRERFARGEITREQFEEAKTVLG